MFKKIVFILLSIFLFISFYIPIINANSLNKNLETLQDLSQSLYENVKIKDYEKAKLTIEEISELLPSVRFDKLTTVEGIEAISSTIIQIKRNLASLTPKYKPVLHYTTQLHLAIDALSHKEQPLWHRYYSVLHQDIEKIKKTIKDRDLNQNQVAIQHFQFHYQLIKPAILVTKQPYSVEKIDSLITALVSQTVEQNKEIILHQLEISIHQLFYGDDQETWGKVMKETIIWKTSIGMGLIIFIVLTYVIWRKFKGSYFSVS